ncbi:hypothetical protein JTE90_008928 [Oedothorax gibbosus]|uniref:Pre-mRNA-splicing regulator female-lethal(2)D n=1 Tax=Oedothorax gibbosus TaxID=931172 RepID=A0AAV6UPG6_9ARAC|nr:hypothetical protein JTE90_008928 [Oedothorax gibbosus]
MAAKTPTITRVRVAKEELDKMSKEQLQKCWNLQDQYVDLLENKLQSNSEHVELMSLRESEEKLKQQQLDSSRRENILVMRLTTKEHEMQEFAGQIQELKQAQVPSIAQLRSAMLDPAVNLLFDRMKKEVESLKARLEETQNELSAWKFTPDSNTGKRLMAKCRLLYQENEELGKIISSGRMAKLEGDLALQKSFTEEMKKSQSELDEFLLELDEDVEGMQSTIYYLQTQLREAKEQIAQLQKEKLEQSSTNGISSNHVFNNDNSTHVTSNCKSPLHMPMEEDSHITTQVEDLHAKSNLNGNEANLWMPPIKDEKDSSNAISPVSLTKRAGTPESVLNTVVVKTEPVDNSEPKPPPVPAIAQSVIVENKNSLNHDKQVPFVERTNLFVDGVTTSEKTSEQISDVVTAKSAEKEDEDNGLVQNTVKTIKKTPPEAGKGRKRTRPRTPVIETEIPKEDNLPLRKRTRRREADARQEAIEEENRTSVEIDTDTEVAVAQTLASWASTKADRTELKVEENSLGNGEILRDATEAK